MLRCVKYEPTLYELLDLEVKYINTAFSQSLQQCRHTSLSFQTYSFSLKGRRKFKEVPGLSTTCIAQSVHGDLTSRSFIMYSLEPDCTDVALCETHLPPGRLRLNSAWTGALGAAEKSGVTHLQPVACTVCPRLVWFIKQMMNWKICLK